MFMLYSHNEKTFLSLLEVLSADLEKMQESKKINKRMFAFMIFWQIMSTTKASLTLYCLTYKYDILHS
jgi:hypothetical protein